MQSDAGERRVDPVPADIREMLQRVCLGNERPDEQNARGDEKCRTGILKDLRRHALPSLEVSAEREVDQRREEDVDVTRTHQKPQLLRDRFLIGKVRAHVAPGRREDEEQDYAEDEMEPFHFAEILPSNAAICTPC